MEAMRGESLSIPPPPLSLSLSLENSKPRGKNRDLNNNSSSIIGYNNGGWKNNKLNTKARQQWRNKVNLIDKMAIMEMLMTANNNI